MFYHVPKVHIETPQMNVLKTSIDQIPGKIPAAAKACGVSVRAVYKWIDAGRLPRTDYTGETEYAKQIADISGGAFSSDWLLSETLKSTSDAA